MTDSEFSSLRPGDKVCVDGKQIRFDARVTGPHNSVGEIPIQITHIHYWAENLDYVYKDYKPGHRTTEQNRSSLLRGWISDGASRY